MQKHIDSSKYQQFYRKLMRSEAASTQRAAVFGLFKKNINRSDEQRDELNRSIEIADETRVSINRKKDLMQCLQSMVADKNRVSEETESTPHNQLKSHIPTVGLELKKYCYSEIRKNTSKLEILQNRLKLTKQKMRVIKMDCMKLETIVDDLVKKRQQFHTTYDGTIIQLHANKKIIIELVNSFALKLTAGVETCRRIELLKQKALTKWVEQWIEIQNLNLLAEEFKQNRQDSFFLYSIAIEKDVKDSITNYAHQIHSHSKPSDTYNRIIDNKENKENLHLGHRLEELKSLLTKHYDSVTQIYSSLKFEVEIQDKTDELDEPVNTFNIDAFFEVIQKLLKYILHHSYCLRTTTEQKNSEELMFVEYSEDIKQLFHPCSEYNEIEESSVKPDEI